MELDNRDQENQEQPHPDETDSRAIPEDSGQKGEEPVAEETPEPAEDASAETGLHLVREDDDNSGVTPEQIVEAVLFSSDTPLPISKIASAAGLLTSREIRGIIERLNKSYQQGNSAFRIEEIAGGFQMMTRPEFSPYLAQLFKLRSESKLSPAALETLAIVAYKQPVLRAEVEAIRGVACGEVIRSLMEKDLIKIVGRAEELGRPMLYGTTKKFMQIFGLASLEDLPKVPELIPPGANRPPSAPAQEAPKPEAQEEPEKTDGNGTEQPP